MIPRLRGVIALDPDTKLPGEDGEDAAAKWGARPSPEVKPFGKDPGDTPTHGLGNRLTPRRIPLRSKSLVGTITDLEIGENHHTPQDEADLWTIKRINTTGDSRSLTQEMEQPRKGVYPSHGRQGPDR